MCAERALALADGKESGRPHGRTPRFVVARRVTHARRYRSSILRSVDEFVR